MSMRKIGVIGTFAAGAALALAPLAAAEEPTAPAFNWSGIVNSQHDSMNWLFNTGATLTDVTKGDIVEASDANPFATISRANLSDNDDFAKLIYGSNFAEEMSSGATGSYNLLNGALMEFNNGSNTFLWALMNNGETLDWDSGALFGGNAAMGIANDATSGWEQASDYFELGFKDMLGYFTMPDPVDA